MAGIGLLSEDDTTKICRICFDDSKQNDLISPCLCTGGSAYVHRECLDNWRSLNEHGRGFQYCDVCLFKYIIEPIVNNPSADKKRYRIFCLLVTRDITLIILSIQLFIIASSFLLQFIDKKNQKIKNLYPNSMNLFMIYYLSSTILFLALLGLFGLISYCCGLTDDTYYNSHYRYRNDSVCDSTCCMCYCPDTCCTNCSGTPGCDGDNDCGPCVAILIIIIIIFALIGIFVGIALGSIVIRKILNRHTNRLWLKQETKKYIVKDFQDRRDELQDIMTQRSNREPSSDNETTLMIPSAPMESIKNRDKC